MKTLIIPDVHGRPFWREATQKWLGGGNQGKIVFLGDYVDPYGYEGITEDTALEGLYDIISLKKGHPEQVVLLQGNHDRNYYSALFLELASGGRYSRRHAEELKRLFRDNRCLFQLAYEEEQQGRRYLFTHAALNPDWLKVPRSLGLIDGNRLTSEELNRLYPSARNNDIALSRVSFFRGGTDGSGSILWSDVMEIRSLEEMPDGIYCIFGHTQLVKALITDNWACLDARQAFVLEDGIIRNYGGQRMKN